MEVCGVYFNRFWKLDLGFRNVMEKLGRKLKAKNESIPQIMHLLKIVTEFKKCSFFAPHGEEKHANFFFQVKINIFLKGQTNANSG